MVRPESRTQHHGPLLACGESETMLRGKFAIRDLRLFGHGLGRVPARVEHTGEKIAGTQASP